jgi:predicted acyltransferase
LVIIGWLWNFQFPVIKKLWTSSFVLLAGGYSSLLLAAFFWVIDIKGWKRWCEPLVWVGLNPIAIYLAGELIDFGQLASRLAGGNVQALLDQAVTKGFGALVQSLIALVFAFALARFLHRRKIYVRL